MTSVDSTRMRIAFVVDKCAPFFVGGYENRVLALAEALADRHEVAVFTSLDTPRVTKGKVAFHRIAPTAFQRDRSGHRSLAHSCLFGAALAFCSPGIQQWQPDVVIVQAIPYLHLETSSKWIRGVRCPVVLDVCEAWSEYRYGGSDLGSVATLVIFTLLRRAALRADAIMAISRTTRESLIQRYGVPSGRVTTIPLGIPIPPMSAPAPSLPNSVPLDMLFMNRLVSEKRPLDFVAALARLRVERGWKGRAVIAGGGPMLSRVRGAVKASGLSAQVEVPGFVDDSQKVELLRTARVFVLPSEREGFSLVALEALGNGIPVVAARPLHDEVFGVRDMVQEGVTGALYPLGEIGLLADGLWNLLDDEERRREVAMGAREIARSYSIQTVAHSLEAMLRQVVEAGEGSVHQQGR